MENFLFEYENSFEAAECRFTDALNKTPGMKMWHELLNFYIRCGRFDKADALFADLFENHFEWMEEEEEFAYRGYFDYITRYQRDIKEALKCYLTNKEKLLDADIAGFWELELMFCTNSFNRPERYEKERLKFCERGLIAEQEYHRTAFIAYMVNLNAEKAKEHNVFLNADDLSAMSWGKQVLLPPEEIKYLVWQGKLVPQDNPVRRGMVPEQLEITLSKLAKEKWKRPVDEIIKSRRLAIDRNIAIDAWGLYILAESGELEVLHKFDNVYVTHFTITRLLDEITQYRNIPVRNVLEFLETTNHVQILSADFEHQLKVRDKTRYDEPAGTVAIAEEKMCIAVLGEPLLRQNMIEEYKNMIVRISDIQQLVEAMLV